MSSRGLTCIFLVISSKIFGLRRSTFPKQTKITKKKNRKKNTHTHPVREVSVRTHKIRAKFHCLTRVGLDFCRWINSCLLTCLNQAVCIVPFVCSILFVVHIGIQQEESSSSTPKKGTYERGHFFINILKIVLYVYMIHRLNYGCKTGTNVWHSTMWCLHTPMQYDHYDTAVNISIFLECGTTARSPYK